MNECTCGEDFDDLTPETNPWNEARRRGELPAVGDELNVAEDGAPPEWVRVVEHHECRRHGLMVSVEPCDPPADVAA